MNRVLHQLDVNGILWILPFVMINLYIDLKSIHRFKTALKRSNSGMIKTLPKYYGPPMRCFASFPSI